MVYPSLGWPFEPTKPRTKDRRGFFVSDDHQWLSASPSTSSSTLRRTLRLRILLYACARARLYLFASSSVVSDASSDWPGLWRGPSSKKKAGCVPPKHPVGQFQKKP